MSAKHVAGFLAALFLAAVSAFPPTPTATAQGLQPVSLIAFPGMGNWPVRLAQDKGWFAQNGIAVRLTPTPSSVYQITNFAQGKFDIAMTSIDNVIAYMEGQGEVPLPSKPDFFVFMGGSPSVPSLVTAPQITDYSQIKGKSVAVDATTTGYAFVLFDLLKRHGLQRSDYKVDALGGTFARVKSMREGKAVAAVLTGPFEAIVKGEGFHVMDYAKDVYGHYEESVGTARRSWAKANRPKLVGFIKGYVAAVEWLRNPKNKAEAIASVRKYFPQVPENATAAVYEDFVGRRGVAAKAKLDLAGVRKVLELRSEYGRPKKLLTDPDRYYDPSYYDSAIR